MARVFETQTIEVDPFASPVVNVNLDKDFDVLEAAIIANTVKASGVREITLGLIYDDAVTAQHSLSLETILVGQNITKVANVAISDIQTVQFTEFIDHSIVNDTMRLTILTLSIVGAQVNQFTTEINQLDPFNPITIGTPVAATGTLLESHLVNVGSLVKTTSVSSGTLNSVLVIVSQV